MYVTRVSNERKEAVNLLKDSFDGVNDFIFTDYRGLTVKQITSLRRKLRELSADYRVTKNRFAKIAFKELEYPAIDDCLLGPTAIAMTRDESGPVAKELFDFAKSTSLSIKGALISGKLYDALEVENFSKLPTRIELIAKLMRTVHAPVQKLAYTLAATSIKLLCTMQAVADQKAGKG